jgi:hypothetical protein
MGARSESVQLIFSNFVGFFTEIRLLDTQKFFKKTLALKELFDSLCAPLRPKGRKDSMFADR